MSFALEVRSALYIYLHLIREQLKLHVTHTSASNTKVQSHLLLAQLCRVFLLISFSDVSKSEVMKDYGSILNHSTLHT